MSLSVQEGKFGRRKSLQQQTFSIYAFSSKVKAHRCRLQQWQILRNLCFRRWQWQADAERLDTLRREGEVMGTSVQSGQSTCTEISSLGCCVWEFNVDIRRIHRRYLVELKSHQQEWSVRVQVPEWPMDWMEIRSKYKSASAKISSWCGCVQWILVDLRWIRWQRETQRYVANSTQQCAERVGADSAVWRSAADLLQLSCCRCARLHVRVQWTVGIANYE